MTPPRWVSDVFASVDARDAARFARFITEDGTFSFANAEPVRGRAAIETGVREFFGSIRGCRHELTGFWQDAQSCAMHGDVTYTRLDGRILTLPFANVFVMRDGQIAEYRIFIDLAPLYAPA